MAQNPLAEAAQTVISGDKELQARIRDLVDKMLVEAERQLYAGTPAAKLTMLRSVLPGVVKEARAHEQDGRIIELENQIQLLMIQVRGQIGSQQAVGGPPLLPTDTPPSPPQASPHLSLVSDPTGGIHGERVVKR